MSTQWREKERADDRYRPRCRAGVPTPRGLRHARHDQRFAALDRGREPRDVELHRTGPHQRGTDDSDGSAPKGHRLILRRDPAGSTGAERMRLEAAVLREAARMGVPVPVVIDDCGSARRCSAVRS